MTCGALNPTQVKLLKARATRYNKYKQHKPPSAEHGTLAKEIDQCLVYGLLKHGYDESLPGELSQSVFVPFNKCFAICMENGIESKEGCEVCDSIGDLIKHSSVCMGHPEACPTCRSFYNLLEYHLVSCHTCDMHLCTRLKLKLMKYNITVEGGLVDLWPKIQQYVSRLCPAVTPQMDLVSVYHPKVVYKPGSTHNSGTTDSEPGTPGSPKSPALVARGIEHDQLAQGAYNMGADTDLGKIFNEQQMDMDAFTSKFGDTMGMPASSLYGPGAPITHFDAAAATHDVFMSTGLSSFNSLNLNSIDSKLKVTEGYGGVIMGEPRQLRQLAEYWDNLKKRLAASARNSNRSFKTEVDGVLLTGVNSGMHTVDGQYSKNRHWRKITYVGSGVAGKCYLAVDIATESQFAVKKIELLKYQPEELELWSELEHPNLVQLFGAIRVKNKVYIFSEFYAAGNLAEFIEGQRMLDQWLSLYFLSQLLHTLVYLSKKNILHEDIKADNIFLKPDSYKVGLGDFGLSRKGKCPPGQKPVGGQHHWSPEKATSAGHGFPADVWALICTFVHMLSGDPPWKRRFADIVLLHFKIGQESPPMEDIPDNLLTMVDTLVRKAWTVDPSERPAADELMQEECFEIILGGYDHTDPIFRSHFPLVPEEPESDMDFESYGPESNLSVDSLLEGMENKDQVVEYLNQIYATLGEEDQEVAIAPPAVTSTPLRRQLTVKQPPMESIVEELDISVDPTDEDSLQLSQKNILERRDMPAISPLVLPKRSPSPAMEKRNSWGRSNTSPSPSTEQALQTKRETLRKQETSPAIILSSAPDDELQGLMGEKNIFDLNPNTSGYQTGSTSMQSGEAGLSLNFQSDGPVSTLADFSSSWLGNPSGSMWPSDQSHLNGGDGDNMMSLIPLKPESSATGDPLSDKFDLPSSLKILKDSLSSSSIEPKCILTIVNGMTKIDQTEVLIRGSETWREIIEQNMSKVKAWNMDGYTYYVTANTEEVGFEVQLNEVVPREKSYVYIYPTQEHSTWQVRNNKIAHAH